MERGKIYIATILLLVSEHYLIKAQDDSFENRLLQTGEPDYFSPEQLDSINSDPQKRLASSFVRIGRGLSSFVRIGKSSPSVSDGEYSTEDFSSEKRPLSTFVSIGKNSPYYTPDDMTDEPLDDELSSQELNELQKRPSSFVRIGRGSNRLGANKYSSFVRIGRDLDDMDKRYSSFVRIGRDMEKTEDRTPQRRGSAFVRVGKFPSMDFLQSRESLLRTLMEQPYFRRTGRIGHSSFIRIGKRDTSHAIKLQLEKDDLERLNRFLRIGKEVEDALYGNVEADPNVETEKNIRDIVSNGKTSKRYSSFVRIGKSPQDDDGYVRNMDDKEISLDTSKRYSSFVRIGKKSEDMTEPEKRYSSFVRIGKKSENTTEPEKRYSSFVRIGKKDTASYIPTDTTKRYSSFVRIGKDVTPYQPVAELHGPKDIPTKNTDSNMKS
ncbi:hypothetical protein CHS0354_010342 [Potamilus streckersoni]|uniref:Uncharacterized protein n=1 Tax=Potamilus streckersoni TaxID=2493646 RepID=A0AAE0TEM2_9BIVA|nr:hypothetical protein CHS0354_010342 [Potamilus streckersoni]